MDLKPKAGIIVATIILCFGVITACTANTESETDALSGIYGYYEFHENVYTNPLSSFMAVKGYMPYFGITENALLILYAPALGNKDGSVQEFAAVFKKEPLVKKDFELLFEPDWHIPDISQYRERYQYAVFSAKDAPEYRLYIMDGEIWLAMLSSGRIWSIYNLEKRDNIDMSTGQAG